MKFRQQSWESHSIEELHPSNTVTAQLTIAVSRPMSEGQHREFNVTAQTPGMHLVSGMGCPLP